MIIITKQNKNTFRDPSTMKASSASNHSMKDSSMLSMAVRFLTPCACLTRQSASTWLRKTRLRTRARSWSCVRPMRPDKKKNVSQKSELLHAYHRKSLKRVLLKICVSKCTRVLTFENLCSSSQFNCAQTAVAANGRERSSHVPCSPVPWSPWTDFWDFFPRTR